MECGADTPSAEALVGWLLEHQELHVAELSDDSESLPSIEGFSDSDSMSDDFEDLEGAFGEVRAAWDSTRYKNCHRRFYCFCTCN